METRRYLIVVIFVMGLVGVLSIGTTVSGYSRTTHQALTTEMVELFNHYNPEFPFDREATVQIIQGSFDEDVGGRPSFHFYDPYYGRGLFGRFAHAKNWALSSAYQANAGIAGLALFSRLQSGAYFGSDVDFSWERAVYEYVHGDKDRAYRALGHVLHLIQDVSVPAHTRNDAHPPLLFGGESLYESWTRDNQSNSLGIADELIAERITPYSLSSVEMYFDKLAGLSNSKFFSNDTYPGKSKYKDYGFPVAEDLKTKRITLKSGENADFAVDIVRGKELLLIRKKTKFVPSEGVSRTEYFMKDSDKEVFNSYWNILSEEAVRHGAGVLELFFKAVEEERNSLALFNKNKGIFDRVTDEVNQNTASAIQALDSLEDENVQAENEESVEVSTPTDPPTSPQVIIETPEPSPPPTDTSQDEITPPQEEVTPLEQPPEQAFPQPADSSPIEAEEQEEQQQAPPSPPIVVTSGGSGGRAPDTAPPIAPTITSPTGSPIALTATSTTFSGEAEGGTQIKLTYLLSGDEVERNTFAHLGAWSFLNTEFVEGTTTISIVSIDDAGNISETTTEDVVVSAQPEPPTIISPENNSTHNTTSITFNGTASSTISTDYSADSTTVDASGNWSLTLTGFSQGTTTISFFATSDSGVRSTGASIAIAVDTTAPTLSSFSVLECENSLISVGCLSGEADMDLSWSSTAGDIAYYDVLKDGTSQGTTTATSTSVNVSNGATATLSIVAYDTAGNSATSSEQTAEVFENPVVINEIAWAGTKADSADEWVELYNRTAHTIDLSKTALLSSDGVPYIPLTGTVSSGGYYLLERTDDTTTSVSASQTSPFSGSGGGSGLSNTGEELSLVHGLGATASTTLDATPTVALCSGWCAGTGDTTPASMERDDPSADGTLSSSWQSNDIFTKNGTDSVGDAIHGTPGAQNSTNLLAIGYYCSPDTVSYEEGSYQDPSGASISCTYGSTSFTGSAKRYGDLYKGTVASSTIVIGHSLGSKASKIETDSYTGAVQDDDYFVAIYVNRVGLAFDDLTDFRSFFQTGGAPPHLDYGIIRFKYGTAP